MKITSIIIGAILFLFAQVDLNAKDYYVHPVVGNDTNSGFSRDQAFKSLDRVNQLKLKAGDKIYLASGEVFDGGISFEGVKGSQKEPIIIQSLGWEGKQSENAIINAKSMDAGISLVDCSWMNFLNLEIKADGYDQKMEQKGNMRCGILITNKKSQKVEGIDLDRVFIHDVFFENAGFKRGKGEVKTANGTQKYGWGIRVINSDPDLIIQDIRIKNCKMENVAHTGIKLTGKVHNIQQVEISNNQVLRTGGPGIQMSGVRFVYVTNNEVKYSGSPDDSRKWGRGSGLWTWGSSHVLIEKNKFMHANGPGDSAGAHIDFNCDNVVLQYNFSAFNAGGFCEILGNNYNCAYRFNISVNDGIREKGKNGAFQEGKVFWLSGYQGKNKPRKGPVNSYFYNNTIFVSKEYTAKVAIEKNSSGILIANNIFCIEGESKYILGDQYKADDGKGNVSLENVVFNNNLFFNETNWPTEAIIKDQSPVFADPKFKAAGGYSPEDYIPTNVKAVNLGGKIERLERDPFGLIGGMKMEFDFLGNKIGEANFIGAIRSD